MNSTRQFHERCLEFSVGVLRLTSSVRKNPNLGFIANQLQRSATSGGANAQEARSAESRADFIHKLHIALKELRETGYWLTMLEKTISLPWPEMPFLRQECNELTAILVASIRTARANGRSEKRETK
jgi:four helix bundle protein